MKTSTKVTLTRNELELVKAYGTKFLTMLAEEFGLKNNSEELHKILTTQVKCKVKASTAFGAAKYKLHLTDLLEVNTSIEISEVGMAQLLELGDAIVDYVLPIFKAIHAISKNKDGIERIKARLNDLDKLAAQDCSHKESKVVIK